MLIANIIRYNQLDIYNYLIDVFRLDDIEPDEIEPIRHVVQPDFPEDDYEFRKIQEIVTERKAVEI